MFFGVNITEEVDGVGDRESGDTITVSVETVLEAFFEQLLDLRIFPQLLKYQDCWSISFQIKGIMLCLCVSFNIVYL